MCLTLSLIIGEFTLILKIATHDWLFDSNYRTFSTIEMFLHLIRKRKQMVLWQLSNVDIIDLGCLGGHN